MELSPNDAATLFKLNLLGDADMAALRVLDAEPPDRATAVKTALKLYLRRFVEGEVPPYDGVRAINLELTLAFYPHGDSPLRFFPRQEGEADRHGVL